MAFTIESAQQLPPAFGDLVAAASSERLHFVARLEREWSAGIERFDGPGEFLLLAWEEDSLAGVGGLNADPFAGDPWVGRLRHLYVRPDFRRRGLGRELALRIIEKASETFAVLRVRSFDAGAFYESLGFERTHEPEATHRLPLTSPHESMMDSRA